MSAGAPTLAGGAALAAVRTGALTQVGHLARRSVVRTARQPAVVVSSMVFPLFLLAINASGLAAATDLPGFPTDSYLTFFLAVTFMQGALFSTMGSGQAIAEDIERGFFNRLQLTPLHGAALIGGQLAGTLLLGVVQALGFLVIGLSFGADLEAGIAGALVLVSLSCLTSVAFGTVGLTIGLRTGNGEAVQGAFPLLFVFLFLSSMALPRNLIEHDWFATVATINPVSYLIEAYRSLLIEGWNGEALALGLAVAIGILTAGLVTANAALRTRMERT